MKKILILFIAACSIFFTDFVLAQAADTLNIADAQDILKNTITPTELPTEDVPTFAGTIVEWALRIVGLIFLILMIYAGIMWMTARDDEELANRSKRTLTTATIGVIITVGAYAITVFIVQGIMSGPQEDGGIGPQACCQDRVNAGWACRITSESECMRIGTQCEAGDNFCQLGDVNFLEGITDVSNCIQTCDDKNANVR